MQTQNTIAKLDNAVALCAARVIDKTCSAIEAQQYMQAALNGAHAINSLMAPPVTPPLFPPADLPYAEARLTPEEAARDRQDLETREQLRQAIDELKAKRVDETKEDRKRSNNPENS